MSSYNCFCKECCKNEIEQRICPNCGLDEAYTVKDGIYCYNCDNQPTNVENDPYMKLHYEITCGGSKLF